MKANLSELSNLLVLHESLPIRVKVIYQDSMKPCKHSNMCLSIPLGLHESIPMSVEVFH